MWACDGGMWIHLLCSYMPLLCTTSPWSMTCLPLEWSASLVLCLHVFIIGCCKILGPQSIVGLPYLPYI